MKIEIKKPNPRNIQIALAEWQKEAGSKKLPSVIEMKEPDFLKYIIIFLVKYQRVPPGFVAEAKAEEVLNGIKSGEGNFSIYGIPVNINSELDEKSIIIE